MACYSIWELAVDLKFATSGKEWQNPPHLLCASMHKGRKVQAWRDHYWGHGYRSKLRSIVANDAHTEGYERGLLQHLAWQGVPRGGPAHCGNPVGLQEVVHCISHLCGREGMAGLRHQVVRRAAEVVWGGAQDAVLRAVRNGHYKQEQGGS